MPKTLEQYLKAKNKMEFFGDVDCSNMNEGGDLRITLKFNDEWVDLDIKGNKVIVSQIMRLN